MRIFTFEVSLATSERVKVRAAKARADGDFVIFEGVDRETVAAFFRPLAVISEGTAVV